MVGVGRRGSDLREQRAGLVGRCLDFGDRQWIARGEQWLSSIVFGYRGADRAGHVLVASGYAVGTFDLRRGGLRIAGGRSRIKS